MQQEQEMPGDGMTPELANQIIHSHRRVRYGTACWPCRQRKVKCDRKKPCDNCMKREHPRLCSYKPQGQGSKKAHRKRSAYLALNHGNESSNDESQTEGPAMADSPDQPEAGSRRFLGRNSIPFLLQDQTSSPAHHEGTVPQDIQSILGLDTSAPFPLMSPHQMQIVAQDISDALPSNREVIKIFRVYKEIPHQFWGYVVDLNSFETKLMVYLEHRSRTVTRETPSLTVTASWLAILFAVLSLGSQFNDAPYHIRTRDSQKYIQTAFHYLRLDNFLLRPSLNSIQALLLTGLVLLNDMKAEASWALMGLTSRLAQSIGMHRQAPPDSISDSQEIARRQVWWGLVWHDTLMSLSFDRSPVTNSSTCPIPGSLPNGQLSYLEFMYHLTEIGSHRLNPDTISIATYDDILETCQAVEALRCRTSTNIQFKDQCKSTTDHLQNYAIRLNASFIISVACRPVIQKNSRLDPGETEEVADLFKTHLKENIRMFLAMHQLSVIPTRSWAFIYHGLSSALLLGIICQTNPDPEVRQLQGDLINSLSATSNTENDRSSPEPHIRATARDIELSGHLWRALAALKNLHKHGSVVSSNRNATLSTSEGNNAAPFGPPDHGVVSMADQGSYPTTSGPENMPMSAETQTDMCLQRVPPFEQHIGLGNLDVPNPGISSLGWMDSLAPLDLYESIWRENPNLLTWGPDDDGLSLDFSNQNVSSQQ